MRRPTYGKQNAFGQPSGYPLKTSLIRSSTPRDSFFIPRARYKVREMSGKRERKGSIVFLKYYVEEQNFNKPLQTLKI